MTEQDITAHLIAFINSLQWSADATEYEKSLVVGNLHGFAGQLRTAIQLAPPPLLVTLTPGNTQQVWATNPTTGGGQWVTVVQPSVQP